MEESVQRTLSKGHTYLVGGEAAQHVGADQDPKKMGMEYIMGEVEKNEKKGEKKKK